VIGLVIWLGVGVAFIIGAIITRSVGLVFFGLLIAVLGGLGLLSLAKLPIRRIPAVVAGKGEHIAGAGGYYTLTIETANGRRETYSAPRSVYVKAKKGDMGIAYIKGGFLLDFKPAQVLKS